MLAKNTFFMFYFFVLSLRIIMKIAKINNIEVCSNSKIFKNTSNKKVNSVQNLSIISFKGSEKNPKQIAFFTTEAVPIEKAGGMGDVVSELSTELKNKGFDTRIFMPLYNYPTSVSNEGSRLLYTNSRGAKFFIKDSKIELEFRYGQDKTKAKVYEVDDPKAKVPIYMICIPETMSKKKK